MTGPRRWLTLAVLCLAVLMVAVDATVLNLAVPEITRDLDASATQVLWILDVYSLVLAGLLVSAGTLSDRLGRKRVLLAGCSLFGVASLAAAYAPDPETLIAARVLLGIGGATIMPSTLAIIRNVFEVPRERTLAIGLWSAMAAAGAAVGPILGGALLENFWWGSVFLVNIPVMALLLVTGGLVLPEFRAALPGRWDWPSAVGSMVGLVALVLTIKNVAKHGVGAGVVLTGLIAVAALVWFVRRQQRLDEPLIDVALFARRAFTGAVLGNLFSMLALSGLLLFVSQHLQLVLGNSPLEAGLRMLPLTLGALAGAPSAGALVRRAGTRVTVTAGLLVTAAGMVGFAVAVDQPYGLLAVAMFVVGAGVGVALTATSDAIVTAAPPARAGAASSISETAYELGTGLGIAVLGVILTALYTSSLPDLPGLTGTGRDSLAGALDAGGRLPAEAGATLIEAARSAFVDALGITSLVSAGLLVAAALVAALMLDPGRQASPRDA